MDGAEEISSSLAGGARVILISERDVDLREGSPPNRVVLLRMAEGSLAAGGRGGGYGERRVVRVTIFEKRDRDWTKAFETDDQSRVETFEVPYYVSRLPYFMPDGSEEMGYGVVDPDLVRKMMAQAGTGP